MKTGVEYLESLRDGRRVFIHGRRIDDVAAHRALSIATTAAAATYDLFHDRYQSGDNPVFRVPTSVDDLRHRIALIQEADVTVALTSSVMALVTASSQLAQADPVYRERILRYVELCREQDLRVCECITDAKGDRSLSPSKQDDPDLYLRTVERRSDGIVVRGAKFHITAAPIVHELVVMPTKRMRPGEEDYAVAFAVPVNTPGVTLVSTDHAPPTEDQRHYPFSSRYAMPDATVFFDDVFVPNERVFLDGYVEHSAAVAHALGLWERLSGVAELAHLFDILAGLAQLLAEANGTAAIGHVKDKITDIAITATLVRSGMEAALANAETSDDGMICPSELYTNAAKYHAASQYAVMVRNLHDIAGGGVATAPSMADLDSPELHDLITKYLRGATGIDARHRMALFHAVRDLTADAWGGREAVSWLQSGGGLFAQRIVLRNHYDMEGAKRAARVVAGLET